MLSYSSPSRADRGVAIGRVAVSAAMTALSGLYPFVAIGPTLVVWGLGAYTVWSLALLAVSLQRSARKPLLQSSALAIDFVVFGVLLAAVTPGSPPLLMYLLFPLGSAAVSLTPRGFIISSVAATLIYCIAGARALSMGAPVSAILLRILLLVILSALISHLRMSEDELRRHLTSLALWRHENGDDLPVRDMLARVADMFRAPRVVLAWEENDEPWLHLAWRAADEFRWIRESPTRFEPLVNEVVAGLPFLCRSSGDDGRVFVLRAGRIDEVRMPVLNPSLITRFGIGAVMGVPVRGATFSGLLLVLDRGTLRPEDLHFGNLVGDFLSNRFDLHYLLEREAESAVAEERIRLSRDLHDGVLQSLTGASLQLEAVRRLVERNPGAAIERLGEIQKILATDQRELRAFIRQLRPPSGRHHSDSRLRTRLTDLRERFRTQWGLEVEVDTSGLSQVIFHGLRNEIYSLISEAVANAARHAAATTVSVCVSSDREAVRILIIDNGQGFPFKGRFALRDLDEERRGPVTLKERVASLGGDMTLTSTDNGSTIEMLIPFNWAEGAWPSGS